MKMFWLRAVAICVSLGVASCGSAPDGEDPAGGDHPGGEKAIEETEACASRPLETCADDAGCLVLTAMNYDVANSCRYRSEPVACAEAGPGCGDALTYATDPTGRTWLFPDTCIPEGWQAFQECQADRDAAEGPWCLEDPEPEDPEPEDPEPEDPEPEVPEGACSDLPLDGCTDAGCRVVAAIRYEASEGCRYPSEPVACIEAGTGCADALGYATDPDGRTWLFGDLCIPDGWQLFQETQADRDAAEGPLCR